MYNEKPNKILNFMFQKFDNLEFKKICFYGRTQKENKPINRSCISSQTFYILLLFDICISSWAERQPSGKFDFLC